MKYFFTLLFLVGFLSTGIAQETEVDSLDYFEGIHSVYDDDLSEWEIYTHQLDGQMQITWALKRDFTHWSFDIGEVSGTIRQLWNNNDTHYELNTLDGNTVTMRTKWPRDHSEWVIKSERTEFIWKSTQYNDGNEWGAKSDKLGEMYMFTEYEDDPRDWLIDDYFPEELLEEKLAAYFITLIRAVNNFH